MKSDHLQDVFSWNTSLGLSFIWLSRKHLAIRTVSLSLLACSQVQKAIVSGERMMMAVCWGEQQDWEATFLSCFLVLPKSVRAQKTKCTVLNVQSSRLSLRWVNLIFRGGNRLKETLWICVPWVLWPTLPILTKIPMWRSYSESICTLNFVLFVIVHLAYTQHVI